MPEKKEKQELKFSLKNIDNSTFALSKDYEIEEILGQNLAGGRVTYKARSITNKLSVVIKQFQFAKTSSDWSAYSELESEINILKQLNHPGIPRYLDSFETKDGFCLVTEYKNARQCSSCYTFEAVKKIALEILQILVYLQQPNLGVIHRDIKPENILVGENFQVYLVDFGFAKNNDLACGASSMVKGTFGFMSPEQTIGRKLDLSSDLYSLGITLACLLTGTSSKDVGELFDDRLAFNWQKLPSKINPNFLKWLKKLTQIERKKRFLNASIAARELSNLKSNPEVKIVLTKKAKSLRKQILSCGELLQNNTGNFVEGLSDSFNNSKDIIVFSGVIIIGLTIPCSLAWLFIGNPFMTWYQTISVYESGKKEYRSQDYGEAIGYYDLAIRKAETSLGKLILPESFLIDNLFERGNSYYYLKDYRGAIESYDRLMEISPNNSKFYYNRALAYVGLNEFNRALVDFDRAIKLDPNYTKAIKNREIIRIRHNREQEIKLDRKLEDKEIINKTDR